MNRRHKTGRKRPCFWIICALAVLLLWLAACSSEPEVVEVTRIVTETEIIEIEGEPVEVEVTRVVTETVIETVEIEVETEETEDTFEEEPEPPLATGSEDDSGPLPTEPDDGPKVNSRGGSTNAEGVAVAEAASEAAVPRRANPTDPNTLAEPAPITVAIAVDSNEWPKQCQLAQTTHKKQCN